MMSLTFGLFTQVSGSGPLGPFVSKNQLWMAHKLVIRPVSVCSGKCTTQMMTNEKQRKTELTNN